MFIVAFGNDALLMMTPTQDPNLVELAQKHFGPVSNRDGNPELCAVAATADAWAFPNIQASAHAYKTLGM